MPRNTNRQLCLARRPGPADPVSDQTWEIREAPIPAPADGQVLIRNLYVSVDPAMRGWIRPIATYVDPVPVGGVMRAGTVGRVEESRHPSFRAGDYVSDCSGSLGFQDYALSDGSNLLFLAASDATLRAPLHSFAGGLGLNGFTAYFGLLEVGKPQPGETVLVSSAAGATGSIAGQIAKTIDGCRVVGIAGGPEKCGYLRETLGFDAVIDYKALEPGGMAEAVAAACPAGVDVYFDNVGGSTLDAALLCLNRRGRIVVCGTMSQSGPNPESVRAHLRLALVHGRMEGFIAFEYGRQFHEALNDLLRWREQRKLQFREEIVEDGFGRLPESLNRLFAGRNFGKLILDIGGGAAAID